MGRSILLYVVVIMDIVTIYSFSKLADMINTLDLYSRIMIGQYNHITDVYIWSLPRGKRIDIKKLDEIQDLLYSIRHLFIPSLSDDSRFSLGIWSPETPEKAIKAYDIQQVLRYQLAYYEYPEGGNTVNFYEPYINGDWEITSSEINRINKTIEKFGYRKNRHPTVIWNCPVVIDNFLSETCVVKMNKQVFEIIHQALLIQRTSKILKLELFFKFYIPIFLIQNIRMS